MLLSEPARAAKPLTCLPFTLKILTDSLKRRGVDESVSAKLALEQQSRGNLTHELGLLCEILEARCCVPTSGGDEFAKRGG
jgi:hypothetical protein